LSLDIPFTKSIYCCFEIILYTYCSLPAGNAAELLKMAMLPNGRMLYHRKTGTLPYAYSNVYQTGGAIGM
jgi:hypothetical protein